MAIKKDITWRVGLIYFFVLFCSLSIFLKILYLQIVQGQDWKNKQTELTSKTRHVEANRGNILAADGRKLACSVPSYMLYMDLMAGGLTNQVFNNNVDSLAYCLSAFFKDNSKSYYKNRLINARRSKKRYFCINRRRVSFTELKDIRKFPIFRLGQNRGGFIIEEIDRRKQPFGMLASRTIGKLYKEKELGGMVGLEQAFNDELKGKPGMNSYSRISGRWVPEEIVAPQNGMDIKTSLDIDIQDVAEKSLNKQLIKYDADHGSAIVMEVATGQVKAIVNLYRTAPGKYIEDHFNYAIGEASEPGSTFKVASFTAILEDGYINLDDSIDTGNGRTKFYDRVMRDSHFKGFGKITYRQVLEKSSNVGTSKMIFAHYKSNPKRYVERLYSMGLNNKLGLQIRGEGTPMIKYPGSKSWSGVTLPWMSIGYEVKLTPLQILSFYNAIANNGKMMRPYFVTGIYDNGILKKDYKPYVLNPSICSHQTIDKLHSLLRGVVEHGTAKNINNVNYEIAGKTGTAQMAKGASGYKGGSGVRYQASFCGYFPADNPKYSCIVVSRGLSSKKGYYGAQVSGTVFKAIADRIYASGFTKVKVDESIFEKSVLPYSKGGEKKELLTVFSAIKVPVKGSDIKSKWVSTEAKKTNVNFNKKVFSKYLVPNVKGMGAKDAVALMENLGLRVVLSGRGSVVSQSVRAGSRISKGQRVILKLR